MVPHLLLHKSFIFQPGTGSELGYDISSGLGYAVGNMCRGIEWSLRALASTRATRLFLRARAVVKYVLRAARTLKDTDGEQRALRKFSRLNL